MSWLFELFMVLFAIAIVFGMLTLFLSKGIETGFCVKPVMEVVRDVYQ